MLKLQITFFLGCKFSSDLRIFPGNIRKQSPDTNYLQCIYTVVILTCIVKLVK